MGEVLEFKAKVIARTCPHCGKGFIPRTEQHVYYNLECLVAAKARGKDRRIPGRGSPNRRKT